MCSVGSLVKEASPPRSFRWLAEFVFLWLSDPGCTRSCGWWPGWRSGPVGHRPLPVAAHTTPPGGSPGRQLVRPLILLQGQRQSLGSAACKGRVLQRETRVILDPWASHHLCNVLLVGSKAQAPPPRRVGGGSKGRSSGSPSGMSDT